MFSTELSPTTWKPTPYGNAGLALNQTKLYVRCGPHFLNDELKSENEDEALTSVRRQQQANNSSCRVSRLSASLPCCLRDCICLCAANSYSINHFSSVYTLVNG